MPFSYQNIGFTAILVMIGFLVTVEAVRYIKRQVIK